MPKLSTDPPAEEPAAKKPAAKKPAATRKKPVPPADDDFGFVSLDDHLEPVNALYYGREGTGKTTAAAHLANRGRVLYINAEAGLKRQPLTRLGVETKNLAVWPGPGQTVGFEGLRRAIAKVETDLASDPNSWYGVVLDSLTDIHQSLLDEVTRERTTAMANQGRAVDEWFTDLKDYGTSSKKFRSLLRRLRDLPCHVIITALERRDVDDDTGSVQYGPAVTPGIANDVLGYMDIVVHTSAATDDKPFRGLTANRGKYRAKDRFGLLPEIMPQPTADRLVDYVEGKTTRESDPHMADAAAADEADTEITEEKE